MSDLRRFLEGVLPEIFPGKDIDRLTGNIFRWRSIQNLRCKGEIPSSCFLRLSPRKVLVYRDNFLDWVAERVFVVSRNEEDTHAEYGQKSKPP